MVVDSILMTMIDVLPSPGDISPFTPLSSEELLSGARLGRPVETLLVEDHPVFGLAVSSLLESSGFNVVGHVTTVEQAKRRIDIEGAPDLVLCDIQLPDGCGTELCAWIMAKHPQAKVVFLTSSTEATDISRAMEAGGCGFITKHIDPIELVRLLRTAAVGGTVLDSHASESTMKALRRTRDVGLTEREVEVLCLLDQGLGTAEIAGRLFMSAGTVKTHLSRASNKLGTSDRLATLASARQRGLLRTSTTRAANR